MPDIARQLAKCPLILLSLNFITVAYEANFDFVVKQFALVFQKFMYILYDLDYIGFTQLNIWPHRSSWVQTKHDIDSVFFLQIDEGLHLFIFKH